MLLACAPAAAAPDLRVRGNKLVDGPGRGHVVVLRGVNRSGLEYACIQGWGFFDSPHPDQIDDPSMIAAMLSWDINVVRVPLNEDCWLGVNSPRRFSGAAYRQIVVRYVRALQSAGMYVILDLHWAAPGRVKADKLLPMADQDHAPAFWRSVARTFKGDGAVILDLYNEPYAIDWACWLNGCEIPARYGVPAYRTAGMQELVDTVRKAGAKQPLLLGGLGYASDLSGWGAHAPRDPLHDLIASEHNYQGLTPCKSACQASVTSLDRSYPVLFDEFGETDCKDGYIDQIMAFADRLGIGYLGWAWDAGSWTCTGGPSLISNYKGTPTAYGVGLRNHLRALGIPARPS